LNRLGLFAGLAGIILVGAFGLIWFDSAEPEAPGTTQIELAKAPETTAAPEPAPAQATKKAPEPKAAAAPAQAPAQAKQPMIAEVNKAPAEVIQSAKKVREPAPSTQTSKAPAVTKPSVVTREVAPPSDTGPVSVPPTFDVVRIEPSGETVAAGRATPGSTLRLLDGTRVLAEVGTNENGEWVIVLRIPLAPGTHELSLESHLTSGEVLLSENIVVVDVPAPALVAEAQPPAATPASPATTLASPAATPASPATTPAITQTGDAKAATPASPATTPASPTATPASPATTPASPATAPAITQTGDAKAAPAPAASAPAVVAAVPKDTARPLAVLMSRSGTGPSRILQAPEPVPSSLGDKALLLETVDYDESGQAVIGGRGAAGSVLLLYLDDRPAGRTVVGAAGRWRSRLDGEVPFGVHTLRVDQLGKGGQVIARVATPFSRANLVAATGDDMAVIVQPGNSLWRIARRVYGEGVRYSVIYAANRNQIGDPDLIFPGQIFVVPTRN